MTAVVATQTSGTQSPPDAPRASRHSGRRLPANLLAAVWEGILLWWALTPPRSLLPSRRYLHWRLGTVYGSFHDCECKVSGIEHKTSCATGRPRPLGDLIRQAWGDREQVMKFLRWRKWMRRLAKQSR